jgi:peptidoglycan/xylan/chitin deacetylase (PgdA/CDA1 family)
MKLITSWDDGCRKDLRLAKMLYEEGVDATFYWPCALEKSKNLDRVKQFLTMNDCKEIANFFNVGSHGYNHMILKPGEESKKYPFACSTMRRVNWEIVSSRMFWQDATGQDVDSFSYPSGKFTGAVKKLVEKAGYKNARSTEVGSLDGGSDPYETPTTVHVGFDRSQYGDLPWEKFAEKMVEKSKSMPDAVFHLFGHSWEIDISNSWNDLRSLLKTLKALSSD